MGTGPVLQIGQPPMRGLRGDADPVVADRDDDLDTAARNAMRRWTGTI